MCRPAERPGNLCEVAGSFDETAHGVCLLLWSLAYFPARRSAVASVKSTVSVSPAWKTTF